MENPKKPTLEELVRNVQFQCSGMDYYDIITEMQEAYLLQWGYLVGAERLAEVILPINVLKRFFIVLDQEYPFGPKEEKPKE